jgi:hypothetical protein
MTIAICIKAMPYLNLEVVRSILSHINRRVFKLCGFFV